MSALGGLALSLGTTLLLWPYPGSPVTAAVDAALGALGSRLSFLD